MKKIFILCLLLSVLSVTFYTETSACPKCNEDFKKELLENRANTLGGQELLETIKNQSGSNPNVILPVKYVENNSSENAEVKQDITENNIDENSISIFTVVKLFVTTWFYIS